MIIKYIYYIKDAQGRNIALASVMSRILHTDTSEKVYYLDKSIVILKIN